MPRVPVYQDKQRMNPQNPTGFQSAERAGIVGDAIAGLGRTVSGLADAYEKVSRTKKSFASKYYKNLLEEQYQKQLYEQQIDKSDGSKDLEKFESSSEAIEDFAIKQLEETFGTYDSDEIRTVAIEIKNGFRSQAQAIAFKKQEKFLMQTALEINQQHSNKVFNNPESLNDVMWEAIDFNTQTLADNGRDEFYIKEANKSLAKNLTRTAIDGYADKGRFREARNLLIAQGVNYTGDEIREIKHYIDEKEMDYINNQQKMSELEEKKRKDKEDKEITAYMNIIRAKLIEAEDKGDVAAVSNLRKEFTDMMLKKYPASSKFGGNLDEISKYKSDALKERDREGSFNIAKKFIKSDNNKDLENLQKEVIKQEAFGNISNKKAQEWLLRIENKMKMSLSPENKIQYKAYKEKLKIWTKSEDIASAAQFFNKDPSMLQRYYGTHAYYDLKISEGVEPKVAYAKAINKFFPTMSRGEIIPGYEKMITTKEDLEEAKKFAEELGRKGDPYYLDFKKYLDIIENNFILKDFAAEEIKKIIEADEKRKNKEAMEDTEEFFDEIFNPKVIPPYQREFDEAFRVPERR